MYILCYSWLNFPSIFFSPFRFVSSVIPPEGQELKGDEVDTIVKFKKALGIDDPEAAAMHMEVLLVSCLWDTFQFVRRKFEVFITLKLGYCLFIYRLVGGFSGKGLRLEIVMPI